MSTIKIIGSGPCVGRTFYAKMTEYHPTGHHLLVLDEAPFEGSDRRNFVFNHKGLLVADIEGSVTDTLKVDPSDFRKLPGHILVGK